MDLLIKNMEMPNGCYDCPLGKHEERSYYYECNASDGVNLDWYTIPAYCPLVELPPHGDLIDRSKLVIHGWIYDDGELQEHADYYDVTEVQNAPTILEASDGYTN